MGRHSKEEIHKSGGFLGEEDVLEWEAYQSKTLLNENLLKRGIMRKGEVLEACSWRRRLIINGNFLEKETYF